VQTLSIAFVAHPNLRATRAFRLLVPNAINAIARRVIHSQLIFGSLVSSKQLSLSLSQPERERAGKLRLAD
jgi:hypothetical protein